MRRSVMAVVFLVALSSCGTDRADTSGSISPDSVSPTSETYALVGGATVDLAALRADKPIALWFWAPG